MSRKKRIDLTITFDDDGNPSIDVSGAVGTECTAITEPIEKALGTTVNRIFKPEYRQTVRQTNKEVQR